MAKTSLLIADSELADVQRIARAIGKSTSFVLRDAVARYLMEFRRAKIDKAFEGMGVDVDYQTMTARVLRGGSSDAEQG